MTTDWDDDELREAYNGLRKYFAKVTSRATGAETTDDLVQDTLLKVLDYERRWGRVEKKARFASKAARSVALDSWRHRGDWRQAAPGIDPALPADVGRIEALDELLQLISGAESMTRECVALRYSGLTYSEIAKRTSSSEDAVKSRFARLRRRLQR